MGCWAIGGPFFMGQTAVGWGEVDDNESIAAIHAAIAHGVTFFDTADVYGTGHSEVVLGKALKGRRRDVVIATKFGNTFDPIRRQILGSDASPEYIRAACEASLTRLGVECIDLYQYHPSDGVSPEADALARDVLQELVSAGKIRAFGWSTDSVANASVFAQAPGCVAIQHDQNVLADNADMIAFCEQRGLASINRGPLAMGLLTGKFRAGDALPADDVRAQGLAWMAYFRDGRPNAQWLARLASIRDVLTSNGRTLTQGALAWLWARSGCTIPIPGIRTVAQAVENAGAMQFGPLSEMQMREIARILAR